MLFLFLQATSNHIRSISIADLFAAVRRWVTYSVDTTEKCDLVLQLSCIQGKHIFFVGANSMYLVTISGRDVDLLMFTCNNYPQCPVLAMVIGHVQLLSGRCSDRSAILLEVQQKKFREWSLQKRPLWLTKWDSMRVWSTRCHEFQVFHAKAFFPLRP